jgi:signal transduction histidine kinase
MSTTVSDNLRVLLIEDDEIDERALLRYVSRTSLPYDVRTARSIAEGRQQLAASDFDVVLIDFDLRDGTALDILPLLDVPAIVITGSGNERVAVESMKAGASDYIVKDTERQYLLLLPLLIENVIEQRRMRRLADQQARLLAASEERQRIARELHDSVNQTLFSINAISASLSMTAASTPDNLERLYEQLQALSGSALAEMRTLLTELRPGALHQTPLSELIQLFVESRRTHTAASLVFDNAWDGLLAADSQIAFYRIAQEAVNNAIRHANARFGWRSLEPAIGSRWKLRITAGGFRQISRRAIISGCTSCTNAPQPSARGWKLRTRQRAAH